MLRRSVEPVPQRSAEDITRRNIAKVLGRFSTPDFDTYGVKIAPFVRLGRSYTSGPAINVRLRSAWDNPLGVPALADGRTIGEVAIGTDQHDGAVGTNDPSELVYVVIGRPIKALPLGETEEGRQTYLTPQGYLGESVPPTLRPTLTDDAYSLRSYGSYDERGAIIGWQLNPNRFDSSDEPRLLPAVSLHPDRHISNFPGQILNMLGFAAEQASV
jgi:hypothetical protein